MVDCFGGKWTEYGACSDTDKDVTHMRFFGVTRNNRVIFLYVWNQDLRATEWAAAAMAMARPRHVITGTGHFMASCSIVPIHGGRSHFCLSDVCVKTPICSCRRKKEEEECVEASQIPGGVESEWNDSCDSQIQFYTLLGSKVQPGRPIHMRDGNVM